MTPLLAGLLTFFGFGGAIVALWFATKPKTVRFEPDGCDDPMADPAVQAMMREVIRTGRPMHMNRGEAPTFVGPAPGPSAAEEPKR